MSENGGEVPHSAQEATAVNSGAAPAAASSSSTKQDTSIAERIQNARTPADLAALVAGLNQPVEAAPAAKEANSEPPAEGSTPATEPAPASEGETPAEGTTPEPATEPAPEPAAEPAAEPEATDETAPIESVKARLKLREDDEVGRLAIAFQKRDPNLTLQQAVAKAQDQLGETQPAEAEAETAPGMPATIEETDAAIAAARTERKKASTAMDFEVADAKSVEVENLIQHRFNLQRQAETAAANQEATYDRTFSVAERRATDLYPAAGDPNSAFGKEMLRIEADMKANRDPTYRDPEKPLIIAQMAARNLRIAPRSKTAPAAAKAAAPAPVAPGPKKNVIPSGSSVTAKAQPGQLNPIDTAIRSIKGPADLTKVLKELGLPT
jgi:hypothetical protein